MSDGPDDWGLSPMHRMSLVQKALNAEWPPERIAHLVPEHDPVAVRARVEFEGDGEVWLVGEAVRWVRPVVFVRLDDERLIGAGLWLPAADVRRAT